MADSELTGANAAGTPPTGGATPAVGAKRGHWSSVWAALTWLPSKHPKLSSALVLFLGLFLLPQGALIEPIEFPSTAGYDGKVAASRLAHHLRVIQAEAISVRHVSSAPVIPFNSEYFSLPDLDIGAVSLDLGSLLRLLRHTITFGTKFISGEVTQAASSKLILTIQGSLGGSVSSIKVVGPSDDVDALLERAARAFLEQQAPLLMAVYWADASHPRREGETPTSLELVERALADREPRNDREAFILWGWLLSRQARYLEAVDKFQLAERRDGAKDPILYDNWAWALQQLNQFDKAQVMYRNTLAIDPENPYSNNHLALALYQQSGDLRDAQQHCERAIAAKPTYAEACELCAAIVVRRLREKTTPAPTPAEAEQAMRHVRRAIEINPNHCPSYDTLAWLRFFNGEKRAAVTEPLQRGLAMDACKSPERIAALNGDLGWAQKLPE